MTTKRVKIKDDPYFSHELVSVDLPKTLCHVCGGSGKLSVTEGGVIGIKRCIVCSGKGST